MRAARVRTQIGGSDQWGNITAGIDLIPPTAKPPGVWPDTAAYYQSKTVRSSEKPRPVRCGSMWPAQAFISFTSTGCVLMTVTLCDT
ncbi:MAG: hypothetical protein CM1200mP29_09490 [Verrucomicrobiota bacterium]|nr:MAG: hypothetical protein CM1200mP29_09490 [Verrucomicrobiota bacterium]